MGWQDLLQAEHDEVRTLPWLGGRKLRVRDGRAWTIQGGLPEEHGWYAFRTGAARRAELVGPCEPDPSIEDDYPTIKGHLVGNRLIPDQARVVPEPERLAEQTLAVELVEPGLEPFTRAVVARVCDRHVYVRTEFPEGPEAEVLAAYHDRREELDGITGVTPGLDLAFRFVAWRRYLAEEGERIRAAERAAAVLQRAGVRRIGTATGRRALARRDFDAAARAALAVSNAELLETRDLGNGEVVVRYRFGARRLECVVERDTLRVVDSGVCLTDHWTGESGDRYFTLESLPAVIAEAMDLGQLVVYRHGD